MKNIKFRAWDKKECCWVGGFCLHSNGDFSDLINAHIEEPQHMAIADAHWQDVLDHIVIQQYTGIDDKNGKKIFEGDLVRQPSNEYESTMVRKVNWNRFAWFVDNEFIDATGQSHEVIGNIYENPDNELEQDEIQEDTTSMEEKLEALDERNCAHLVPMSEDCPNCIRLASITSEKDEQHKLGLEHWESVFDLMTKGDDSLGSAGWRVSPQTVKVFIKGLLKKCGV